MSHPVHPAQRNVQLGPPLEEGAAVDEVLDPLPWPARLEEHTWYALVPSHVRDQARVAGAGIEYGPEEIPLRDGSVFDRKYLPFLDLVHSNGDDVLVSERLARALAGLVGNGLEFEELPHATPVPVSGHRWFRMRTSGWLGPLTDTRLMPVHGDPTHPILTDGRNPRRIALHPIMLDPVEWTGDEVCWSPWFGVVSADFRLLLVRGRTLAALKQALPGLGCGAVDVRLVRELPKRLPQGKPVVFHEGRAPSPIPLSASLAAVRARAELHELGSGATEADLQHLTRKAPFALPESYLSLLRVWNGLTLYPSESEGMRLLGLELWSVGRRGTRTRNAAELPEYGSYAPSDGCFLFGQDVQENVLWCLDAQGDVHGLGKEGIVYGPATPFETWLGDMVRDLDWAWDHRGTEISDVFLGNSGRM